MPKMILKGSIFAVDGVKSTGRLGQQRSSSNFQTNAFLQLKYLAHME